MLYLADTNVLLRWARPQADPGGLARHAIDRLQERGDELVIVPQVIVEFWCVATRPLDRNGLGLDPDEISAHANRLEPLFPLLPDLPAVHTEWNQLVRDHRVCGVQVHDARLVAAMRVHGVTSILTFNVADFQRYSEIVAVHPRDVQ